MYGDDAGEHLLLPDALQRAVRRSRPSRTTSTSTGILRGMYLLRPPAAEADGPRAQLLASGVAVPWALEAQQLLAETGACRPTSGR